MVTLVMLVGGLLASALGILIVAISPEKMAAMIITMMIWPMASFMLGVLCALAFRLHRYVKDHP